MNTKKNKKKIKKTRIKIGKAKTKRITVYIIFEEKESKETITGNNPTTLCHHTSCCEKKDMATLLKIQ
jgi:hypothetical protein